VSEDPSVGTPADVPILFASPTVARVRPGDTLATVAERHGVPPEDLVAWNGLATNVLEADQILFVWPPVEEPVRPRPAPRARDPRVVDHAPTAAPATDPVATVAPPPPGQKIQVGRSSVRGAGVLGAQLPDGTELDLRSSAAALDLYRPSEQTGLGTRGSLAGGGEAETLVMAVPTVRFEGPAIPDTPVTPPSVPKPAPKTCLSGVAAEIDDELGIVVSNGLDPGQISAGMSGISRYTPRCFPRGTEGTFTVLAEIVVGCDGRVSDVQTLDAGVVPDPIVGCIEQTLASAAFPAHALPDGVTFQIPLKFSF
jgi:hypothetical protein